MLLFFSGLWCLPSPHSLPHVAHAPTVLCSTAKLWAVRFQLLSRHLWSAHCVLTPLLLVLLGVRLWALIPFSHEVLAATQLDSSWMCVCSVVCVCVLSRIWLFVAPWTVARQALLSMKFPRQEDWSGLSFPTPGNLPDPGIEPKCLASSALAGGFFTTTWEVLR